MKKVVLMLCLLLSSVAAMAQREAKTWMLNFNAGAQLGLKDYGDNAKCFDDGATFDFEADYNLSKSWSVGLGTGVWHRVGGAKGAGVPVLANLTYYFPSDNNWNAYIKVRGGMQFKGGDARNQAVLDFTPGVTGQLSENWGLNLGVMFQRTALMGDRTANGGHNGWNLGAKVGAILYF